MARVAEVEKNLELLATPLRFLMESRVKGTSSLSAAVRDNVKAKDNFPICIHCLTRINADSKPTCMLFQTRTRRK